MVRTRPSQGCNPGSTPGRVTMESVLGIIGGALSGFLASLFFWNLDKKKSIPILIITTDKEELGKFYVKNTGFTHALDVIIQDEKCNDTIIKLKILSPNQSEWIQNLDLDETEIILILYKDVWGKMYKSTWRINGPTSGISSEELMTAVSLPSSVEHLR